MKPINSDREIPEYQFDNSTSESGIEIQTFDHFRKTTPPEEGESYHRPDFYTIIFVSNGVGKHSIDFIDYEYRPGSLLLIARSQVTAYHLASESEGFILFIKESFLQQNQILFNRLFHESPFHMSLFEPKIETNQVKNSFVHLFNAILSEYDSSSKDDLDLIKHCFLRILFQKIHTLTNHGQVSSSSSEESYKKTFIRFQAALAKSITETRNANYYCSVLEISYSRLNKICKRLTKKTLKEYIDYALILEIKRMLINMNINISEVAFELGFEEVTNFSKYFKRHVGQTPNDFRKSLFVKH